MLASSDPFTEMIEGVAQDYIWQFGMTLPGVPDLSLALTDIEIEATDNNSTVPAQSRLLVGIPDMQATATLDGLVDPTDETKTVAWLFRRWNPDSPLKFLDAVMAPVTIDLGLNTAEGDELIRKATMWVDSYATNKDGTVTFSLKDRWSTLRALPELAPVVTAPPINAGLTSEFAIDWLLRVASAGAISSSPAQRPHCVFAAMMRSSLWPEVGTLVSNLSTEPLFVPGVFGSAASMATDVNTTGYDESVYTTSGNLGTDIYFESWVTCGSTGGLLFWVGNGTTGGGSAQGFFVNATTSSIFIDVLNNGLAGSYTFPGLTLPSTGVYFAVQLHQAVGSASWHATVTIDGTATASGTQTSSSTRQTDAYDNLTMHRAGTVAVEAVQVSNESSPASNFGFTPQAIIGQSLNPLQVIPPIAAGSSVRDVIQDIGSAELGLPYFDESGIFRFRNRYDIRTDITVARTITSATSLADIDEETIAAAVINRARPGYTGWTFGDAAQLWSLTKPWHIPAHSHGASAFVRTVNAPDGTLWADIDTSVVLLPTGGGTAGHSYYRAATSKAGLHNHPGLDITLQLLSSTTLQITIENHTGVDAWLIASADDVSPDAGTPVLIVGGTPVTADNETQVDFQYPPLSVIGANGLPGAAGTRFGEVPWDDTGNAWRQDADATLQLAKDVVVDGSVPRPNLNNITLAFPDFRLQLADMVQINDPDTTLIQEFGRIFGWTIRFSASDRSMVIDGRTLAAPFGGIVGLTDRCKVNSTAYVYGSS